MVVTKPVSLGDRDALTVDGLRVLYVANDPGDWERTCRHLERAAPGLKLVRAETVAEPLDQLALDEVRRIVW